MAKKYTSMITKEALKDMLYLRRVSRIGPSLMASLKVKIMEAC
jgi:hypothetical protein